MSREIDAAVDPELDADPYRFMVLADLDFPSAPVRVHSGVGDIQFNSVTYKGIGQLGKISAIKESTELQSHGFVLMLSGVDPALISISLNDHIQGRSADIYLGFLDADLQLVGDPIGPFSGRMDFPEVEVAQTATISISVESRLVDWERPRIRRYTDEDQQEEYPGDKGLEFVAQMQEKQLLWGPNV